MKKLSVKAGLKKVYTNHCIRSTAITTLDEKGFEAGHIVSMSGHKQEATIKAAYSKKCPEGKKREMSDALFDRMMEVPTALAPLPPSKKPKTLALEPPQPNQGAVTPEQPSTSSEDVLEVANFDLGFDLAQFF